MDINKPLVTAVIPHYNLGEYLNDAVISVVNQTFKDWELIIVDDGSTDRESINVLKKIEKNHPFMKILWQKNGGLSAARNVGIEQAQGEYIVCLDADDKLHPEYIEKTVKQFVKHADLGIVTSWLKMFDQKDEIMTPKHKPTHELLLVNGIHVASLFKKSAWKKVGGYKSLMKGGYEDWEFWISLIEAKYKWVVVPEVLFYYRVRKSSMVTESRKRHKELVGKIYDLHREFYVEHAKSIAQYASNTMHQMMISHESLSSRLTEVNNLLDKEIIKHESTGSELNATRSELDAIKSSRLTGPVVKMRKFVLIMRRQK